MRFTSSSAFIASTIALLSLMTPVISADVAKITSPVGGQVFLGGVDSVQVQWTIDTSQDLTGVSCDITLLHVDGSPSVPASPGLLQGNVPILNKQSNGEVSIPRVEPRDNYFMELISLDGKTYLGKSSYFKIN